VSGAAFPEGMEQEGGIIGGEIGGRGEVSNIVVPPLSDRMVGLEGVWGLGMTIAGIRVRGGRDTTLMSGRRAANGRKRVAGRSIPEIGKRNSEIGARMCSLQIMD
jgi:hypothetical protein